MTAGRRSGVAKKIMLYPLNAQWKSMLCQETEVVLEQKKRVREPRHWAEHEFGTLRVHDQRLTDRLCQVAQSFYNQPQANIPQAAGSHAAAVATYRLLRNDKISMDDILLPHLEATMERIREHPVVLAPQDTSTLNYSHHRDTEGLGPINGSQDTLIGLLLHDTVAFTPQGIPLGVLNAQCWARDPEDRNKGERRHQTPLEQKESMKWLRSYRKLTEIQKHCPQTMLVSMGDREADIYELFAEAVQAPDNPKVLIRSERSRNRQVEDESLWQHMEKQPCAGVICLNLPKRGHRAARKVHLDVRFAAIDLHPPKKKSTLPPVSLWAVHLREDAPDDPDEVIEWMLLTTVAVANFADAVERAQWYAARWGIEVFHRTLKSGCRIKDRQLGTAVRLKNCLAIDLVVA